MPETRPIFSEMRYTVQCLENGRRYVSGAQMLWELFDAAVDVHEEAQGWMDETVPASVHAKLQRLDNILDKLGKAI